MKKELNHPVFANEAAGTHEGGHMTLIAGVDVPRRYTFGALSEGKVVVVNGKNRAIGVITDAAKSGDAVNLHVMGSNSGTMQVLAGKAIEAGHWITSDAEGRAVTAENLIDGTQLVCGVALQSVNAGESVEFTPMLGFSINNK